ncbi:uncharacterized protein At4g13200, chloroplastic isoform X1 [Sesamum indicum]|uniref:Uncharacterized protein At4g13200, chloroplastic isoform X1 n=1 Tax=Sesamum indicum TaxID=4182 RepID=A0A6I9TPU8_SESIN|nr:uncharacterized protein At4g13200, chloroplastic isoform X1 [Sesamum indicum]
MSSRLTASPQSCSVFSIPRIPSRDNRMFPSNLKPVSSGLRKSPSISLRCNSTGDSGENESRSVLDAFFLGKALGEALTERIESTVGEILSVIGSLQAEQQKQILEFQEEVLEKARRAKEQASRDAVEAQGLVSKSTALGVSTVNSVLETTSTVSDSVISAASSTQKPTNDDPFLGLLNKN